jgi:hypothetical protein
MGLAVSVNGKRTTVAVVVLDDHAQPAERLALQSVTVEETFKITADQIDLAVQLGDAARNLSGRLRSLRPDVVVVRRADQPTRPSNKEGPRLRLLMDGALTAAAQEVVSNTVIRNGKDCGAAYGSSKGGLDADAEGLYGGQYTEATAAALSGLVANRVS